MDVPARYTSALKDFSAHYTSKTSRKRPSVDKPASSAMVDTMAAARTDIVKFRARQAFLKYSTMRPP